MRIDRNFSVRQAIRTRYVGPTDTKPSRIQAVCEAASRMFSYDHELTLTENHRAAAEDLARQLGWSLAPHMGGFGDDYYHVSI